MSDYVFFEYRAVIHLTRNPSASGAAIHCLAKMRANDSEGKPISIEDLKARADELIFFAINQTTTIREQVPEQEATFSQLHPARPPLRPERTWATGARARYSSFYEVSAIMPYP